MNPKEKQIADYILANIKLVSRSSISDLAHNLGVADSTVYQFTKKLGYDGFKDFKVNLLTEEFDSEIERWLTCRHKGSDGPQCEKGDEKPCERAPFHGCFDIVDERMGCLCRGFLFACCRVRLFNEGMGHKRERRDRKRCEQQCRDADRNRCNYEA